MEEVDQLREREDRGISCCTDDDRCNEDEKRFEYLDVLSKQVEAEVDENKVLGQLSEHGKHVFRSALGSP